MVIKIKWQMDIAFHSQVLGPSHYSLFALTLSNVAGCGHSSAPFHLGVLSVYIIDEQTREAGETFVSDQSNAGRRR